MTQAMHRILVVEDDRALQTVLRVLLESAHFRVIEADSAARADIEARAHKPDLLLVDLGLPDRDGLSVIQQIRTWSPVPILVVSARNLEDQKIAALDAGADDYMTKPFSAPELLARVRAALRRGMRGSHHTHMLKFGERRVDLARRLAQGPQGEIHLTPLEYRLIEALGRRSGSIATNDQLLREVWGPAHVGDSRNLRVCIKNLRGKLEPDPQRPKYLVNDPGLGYRLRPDEVIQEV